MTGSFQRRALRKAVRIVGGEPQLRAVLDVSAVDLFNWIRGKAPMPEEVMRRVVAFLAESEVIAAQQWPRSRPGQSAG